jgi:hypothetical protein
MNPSDHAAPVNASPCAIAAPVAKTPGYVPQGIGARRPPGSAYVPVPCWTHITKALLRSSSKKVKASCDALNRRWRMQMSDDNDAYRKQVGVAVLDRPSRSSALLSWKDPTSCNYGYQLWRRSIAKRDGLCAISGHLIKSGDSVYRPRMSPRPANATAMILSSFIENALPDPEEEESDLS